MLKMECLVSTKFESVRMDIEMETEMESNPKPRFKGSEIA